MTHLPPNNPDLIPPTPARPDDTANPRHVFIAACVLGGVSLTGGVGSIGHVVGGALVMGTVQNVMDLKGVSTFYQYVVSGAILLAAVLLDRLKTRGGKA